VLDGNEPSSLVESECDKSADLIAGDRLVGLAARSRKICTV
jgi:hypothetical protein